MLPQTKTATLAIYRPLAGGIIRLRGRDAAALLHRLSTNDIERLAPGSGCRTVLTTPIGRGIDLLTVYRLADDEPHLVVLAAPGQSGGLINHLRKNIFFGDQVQVEEWPQGGRLQLFGPSAEDLGQLGLPFPVEAPFAVAAHDNMIVVRGQPLGHEATITLIGSVTRLDTLAAELGAQAEWLSEAAYDARRIAAGEPRYGREIRVEYIPLETGLWDAVSFHKGCYVGQEIIARMESRGRLAKRLVGLRFAIPPSVSLPARIEADGKEAGDLTSLATETRFGPIGLAYLRVAYPIGSRVTVAGSEAVVVELPFTE